MNGTHFNLGAQLPRNEQYSTMYGALCATNRRSQSVNPRTKMEVFAKKTSVRMNGNNNVNTFSTTNQQLEGQANKARKSCT